MGETRVVYDNGRWWRETPMGGSLFVRSTGRIASGPWTVRELIIPRGHDVGYAGSKRESCAARGCYLCRVMLNEAAH